MKAENYQKNREKHLAASKKAYADDPVLGISKAKAWREANPSRNTSNYLKRLYGITIEQRDALFEAQGRVCAICGTDEPSGVNWHVDHCHSSKAVRGILCHRCNLMLGNARDNPDTLLKAVTYLGKQNG